MNIIDSEILKDLTLNNSTGNNIGIINSTIEKNTDLSFLLTKNIFLDDSTFKGEVKLSINGFLDMQNINFKNITFGKLYIPKEIFEKSVNFERCVFLQDINLKDYTFNEVAFNTCTFKENVYFNNSEFKKEVDFHECEFEKTACFYGVQFDEIPNFSQALFKSNINVINSNLNFDFTRVDEKIKLLSSQGKGKYNYEIANDFRDSFRNFKSALIKDNNLLDASNFHKYELYCKEIELKQNWDKKGIEPQNQQDLEKNTWRVKELMDFLLLRFYRKFCDHHTDFLKVFNNFVLLIALYALFVFGFTWLHYDKLEDTRAILTLYDFLNNFKSCIDGVIALFMILGCVFTLHKIDKNNYFEINFCNFLRYTKNKLLKGFKIVICDIQLLLESMFFALFFY